jgi:chromosome segregation ATPase
LEQLERIRTKDDGGGSGTGTSMAGDAYDNSEQDGASVMVRHVSQTNTATMEGEVDDEDEYGDDASSHEVRPANKDAFSITAQSAKLQLDLLEQVSSALHAEQNKNPNLSISDPTITQALSSYEHAVGNIKGLLMDLLRISRDHEAYWQYRLEREQNVRRLWEDSMAKVAKEQEELENRIGESEERRKRTKKALKEALDGQSRVGTPQLDAPAKPLLEGPVSPGALARRQTIANHEISDDESEDEDEFFDAIDAGEVEVGTMPEPPQSPGPVIESDQDGTTDDVEAERQRKLQQVAKSFQGYEDGLRKRLKIDTDDRPKVSLWVSPCDARTSNVSLTFCRAFSSP